MSGKREKISVNPIQGGLNAAFQGLQMEGLPRGEESISPLEPVKTATQRKPGRVVLRRETAQRGGKVVVVVDGFAPEFKIAEIEALAKRIRAACGCGGTVKERSIEIQGDQAGKVRAVLEAEGFVAAGVK